MGDHVFLKISPFKRVIGSRYIGPFEIFRRWGSVAYELALPPKLSGVHLVFYVSMFQKYLPDESHMLQPQAVKVDSQMSYVEEPIAVVSASSKASFEGNSFGEGHLESS